MVKQYRTAKHSIGLGSSKTMGGDFETSTENIIHATRALIKEGEIPVGSVCFEFEGQELHPDRDGRLPHWPPGFCSFTDDYLSKLVWPVGEKK